MHGGVWASQTKFEPFQITSIELNRRFSFHATGGPLPDQRGTFACEEVTGGTRYTQIVEGEPGGFFRLAGLLLERALKCHFRADLETLKDMLEAQG